MDEGQSDKTYDQLLNNETISPTKNENLNTSTKHLLSIENPSPTPSNKRSRRARKTVGISLKELRQGIIAKSTPELPDYYSDGDGGDCDESMFEVKYSKLSQKDKRGRILYLWKLTYQRSKGAAVLIRKLFEQSEKIFSYGFSKKQNLRYVQTNAGKINEIESESLAIEDLKPSRGVLMPTNQNLQIWEAFMALLLIQNAIYIPGKISYTTDTSTLVGTFDLLVDLCFFIDIFVTFSTAIKQRGYIHSERSYIVKSYIKGDFFLDLFLAMPLQLWSEVVGYPLKTFRLLRVNRRLGKVNFLSLAHKLNLLGKDETPSNLAVKIIQIALTVFYFTHFMACFWFYMAKVTGYPSDSWVVRMGILDSTPQFQYIVSIYWSFQTITTIGYGDISAKNDFERIVAIIAIIVGTGFYSYTIGNLTAMIVSLDEDGDQLQQKFDTLKKAITKYSLNQKLYERIEQSITKSHENKKYFDTEKLLSEVPKYLRHEIVEITHAGIYKNVRYFQDKSRIFLSTIVHELTPLSVGADELIYYKGEDAQQIYFIQEGKVRLSVDLQDFITEKHLMIVSQDENKRRKQQALDDGKDMRNYFNDSFRRFIAYTQGGYFGDSDIFAPDPTGRDSTAMGDPKRQTIIFAMKYSLINRIRDNYEEEFEQLKYTGQKKYKNHQILIYHQVKQYIDMLKQEASQQNLSSSGSSCSSDDSQDLIRSIDSDELDDNYNFICLLKEIEKNDESDEDNSNKNVDEAKKKSSIQKKEIDAIDVEEQQTKLLLRQKKFNVAFEQTLINFQMNIDFLNKQVEQIEKIVDATDQSCEKTFASVTNMSQNAQNLSQTLDTIKQVAIRIKK